MGSNTPDSMYIVNTQDWPVGAREDDLTVTEIEGVLEQFDTFYPVAVAGLAEVAVHGNLERPSTRA